MEFNLDQFGHSFELRLGMNHLALCLADAKSVYRSFGADQIGVKVWE